MIGLDNRQHRVYLSHIFAVSSISSISRQILPAKHSNWKKCGKTYPFSPLCHFADFCL